MRVIATIVDTQIGATRINMAEFTVVADMADIISRATETGVSILRSELLRMKNSLGRMYCSAFLKNDGRRMAYECSWQ